MDLEILMDLLLHERCNIYIWEFLRCILKSDANIGIFVILMTCGHFSVNGN